ncbi:hypothetical protein VB776_13895 [Arcicella sp. DC2W]|uniref:Outer membrane protein beta-barrel domain-containing protein n=1 Tax=Arcicella gelida TaxID=2984195 RepID=A0ABU5S6D2_9BACT|nr:hypothetical protein [Arcicella sp. DC2W]MEA5404017.1 hypothetical protein [Arcicella sp. DC2W]
MKKLLFALFITVLSHYSSKAQKEFMAGYIVNNAGDTIRGKIDNKKWIQAPSQIKFKQENQNVIKYGLSDIQSFVINNEVTYVRKKISLDITPHMSAKLLHSYDRVLVDTTVFLKQLIKGRLNLYYLKDGNTKGHFFIEKLNEPIQELIDHRFLRKTESGTFEVHLDTYNKQLYDLCEDCSNYTGQVFKYLYRETALTPLIIKYNAFFGDNKPVEVSKKEKFKSTFFIIAAVGTYGFVVDKNLSYYVENYDKSGLKSASVGGGVLLDLPSKRRRFGVKIDLLYSFYEEDVKLYSTYVAPTNTSYLGLCIGPQYSIYKNAPKKLDVYLNASLMLEKRLAQKSTDFIYQSLSDAAGYKLGVGTKINRMNVELAYSKTDAGFRPFVYITGNIQKVSLALSYSLGKSK